MFQSERPNWSDATSFADPIAKLRGNIASPLMSRALRHLAISQLFCNLIGCAFGENMASTEQYGSFTIPFVPLDVRYEENKEDFCRVISTLYPKFDVSSLIFKEFTGGITNQVIGVFLKDEEGGFVVRLYGRDTERFVCRKSEVIANQVAAACNVGQKIVCLFNNGSCCELLPQVSSSESRVCVRACVCA